jgi:hypothetical protein
MLLLLLAFALLHVVCADCKVSQCLERNFLTRNFTTNRIGTCPKLISYSLDPVSNRQNAFALVLSQAFCPPRFRTKIKFEAREANGRVFKTHVFVGTTELVKYVNGAPFEEGFEIAASACTGRINLVVDDNVTVIFECQDPKACQMYYR